MKKKPKSSGKKRTTSKSKISAKAKLSARAGSKKSSTKRKRAIRRRPVRENEDVMGSQSVETVPLSAVRQKARSGVPRTTAQSPHFGFPSHLRSRGREIGRAHV